MMIEDTEKLASETRQILSGNRDGSGRKNRSLSARQEAEGRANIYRFLAGIYLHPPGPDLVRQIANQDLLSGLSLLFDREGIAILKAFAAGLDFAQDLPSLKQEYMDLFAVPTGRYVTPFEDVYRIKWVDGRLEKGPLLGMHAIEVRKIYREAGTEMNRACKELPTHIGVELSFMSFLCEKEAESLRHEGEDGIKNPGAERGEGPGRYRELQLRFLGEHLNGWFPLLSQCIGVKAKSLFYKGLALVTEEFLARDTAGLLTGSDSEKLKRL